MKPALPEGAVVRVSHLRVIEGTTIKLTRDQARREGLKVAGKGGVTNVEIQYADGTVSHGTARCSPLDNYSKSKGRMIATGRALKSTRWPAEIKEGATQA